MTPFEKFIQFLAEILPQVSIWWLVKALFVVGLGLYIAFAVIVIRQVGLMSKTLNGKFAIPLKLISYVHLLVALAVFLLALVIL